MLVLRLLVSIVPVAETTKLLSSEVLRQLWLYRKSKQILEALLSKSAAGCNHDDILVCALQVILLEIIKYIKRITRQVNVSKTPYYVC
jgi:hypothetical protein